MIHGVLREWAEDGYFGKGTCLITYPPTRFLVMPNPFWDVPDAFLLFSLRKVAIPSEILVVDSLNQNRGTELLVVV
jgi:hypothetical protein